MKHNRPITIRGVTYSSVEDAAFSLDVHTETVYRARREGKLDAVGLPNRGRKVAVVWDGVEYNSMREASNATGEPYSRIRWYMDSLRGKTT